MGTTTQTGPGGGLLLTSGTFVPARLLLDDAQLLAWGWRPPVLASAVLTMLTPVLAGSDETARTEHADLVARSSREGAVAPSRPAPTVGGAPTSPIPALGRARPDPWEAPCSPTASSRTCAPTTSRPTGR